MNKLDPDLYYCPIDLTVPFLLTEEEPDYNSISHYWRRVAGAGYCRESYIPLFDSRRGTVTHAQISTAFEAVPEPANPWDPCAVRLDLDGKKAGYVNASASPRIYSIARYWELQGWKCALPGAIWLDTYKDRDEFSVSSWVALPTIQEVKNHIPVDLIIRELASWWKIAPQDIRDDLEASRFHLSSKVRRHLLDNHQLVPHVPLEGAAAGPSPLVVDWALAEIRTAFYQEKANKRALKRQQLEAIALEKVRSGMSYAAVARSLGVSPTTISSIAKRHGIKSTGNPIDAPRVVERCREALSLRLSGMSVAEVGRTIGVSSRTAEKLLQDARFYDTPHKYPGRLRLAESHIRGELGDDMEASNNQKRRAHRDAAVLTYLRLG